MEYRCIQEQLWRYPCRLYPPVWTNYFGLQNKLAIISQGSGFLPGINPHIFSYGICRSAWQLSQDIWLIAAQPFTCLCSCRQLGGDRGDSPEPLGTCSLPSQRNHTHGTKRWLEPLKVSVAQGEPILFRKINDTVEPFPWRGSSGSPILSPLPSKRGPRVQNSSHWATDDHQ